MAKTFPPTCAPSAVITQMNETLNVRRTPDILEAGPESRALLIAVAAEYGYRVATFEERAPFHSQRSDVLFINNEGLFLGSYDSNLWNKLEFETAAGWPEQYDGPVGRLGQLIGALRSGE